jgi:hypothetical protein
MNRRGLLKILGIAPMGVALGVTKVFADGGFVSQRLMPTIGESQEAFVALNGGSVPVVTVTSFDTDRNVEFYDPSKVKIIWTRG